jgi:indolepyruvate ferredoxin oxidoreductase beta subunit
MNSPINNVLIAAVGGQGALLAARVLGHFADGLGLEVKVSEVHGMSQRGGSVLTHVRFGRNVFSPVIEQGGVDTIIAFEMLEAARYVGSLRPGGTIIANRQEIAPQPVAQGTLSYPAQLPETFASLPVTPIIVNGQALATRAGNEKSVNSVLLGVYARHMGYEQTAWHRAIEISVPAKHLKTNLAAFDLGYAIVASKEGQS